MICKYYWPDVLHTHVLAVADRGEDSTSLKQRQVASTWCELPSTSTTSSTRQVISLFLSLSRVVVYYVFGDLQGSDSDSMFLGEWWC
jgi:hypothetical protein